MFKIIQSRRQATDIYHLSRPVAGGGKGGDGRRTTSEAPKCLQNFAYKSWEPTKRQSFPNLPAALWGCKIAGREIIETNLIVAFHLAAQIERSHEAKLNSNYLIDGVVGVAVRGPATC